MKLLKDTWFAELGSYQVIGIILCEDNVTKKKTAYIGTASGNDKDLDISRIKSMGAKFPVDLAEKL